MADSVQKEIRRMRTLLRTMAQMAEHVEQTGSFASGVHISVKRYNSIVEHLEENEAIPEEMFPRLDEDADSGQLGAETTLLMNYLDDLLEETPKESGGKNKNPDLGMMIALAPFLEQKELSNLVRQHFTGQGAGAGGAEASSAGPDLKTIVGLAPHLDSQAVSEMVRASIARQGIPDPNLLVALAPHMDSKELGRLLREHLPQWFGGQAAPAGETPPASGEDAPLWSAPMPPQNAGPGSGNEENTPR